MKSSKISLALLLLIICNAKMRAQQYDSIYFYYQIPSYPEKYTAGTVAARVIDGLGYRYYWATEGLTEKDLTFKPNDEARTSMETLRHIYGLSKTIRNAVLKQPNENETKNGQPGFEVLRSLTLNNFKIASDILKICSNDEFEEFRIVFKDENRVVEFPFWNMLNGPIADVLWHTGQVVSFRRSSGNPISSKTNVFTGKTGD